MTRAYRYRRWRHARISKRRASNARPLLFFVVLMMLGIVVAAAGLIAAGANYYADVRASAQTPEQAIAARGGGARVYDRNGTLLYEFLDDRYGLQEPVTLDRVSPLIRDATIAAEDASFYSNPGINLKGIARAAGENLRPGGEFLQGTGGSSITQQLVKQIYFTREERERRSISRKFREAALAVAITRDYEKDQILEWYLNEIPYGGVLTGIEAASQGYFGISAANVTLAQAAFLAGLPQSPGEYDPFQHMPAAIERQHEVLGLMVKHGLVAPEMAAWAKLELIELRPKPRPFLAPHFVQYVADEIKATLGEEALYHGGISVSTTLDLALNERVNAILEEHLRTYEESSQGHNGSVVIIHPPSGQILAMIGSRDYFREDIDGSVNNALALNSPGSTLKPFTYVTAFMQGWGPDWPVIDTPIKYEEVDGKTFSPRNPDGRTRGIIPVKQAFGNSFNIPAFKTILWAGVDNVVATAKSMGITTLDRDLGPALTLGGVDVKLLDMVYGYSVFANNGVMAGVPATAALPPGNRQLDPISILRVTNRRGEVLADNVQPDFASPIRPEYAYMITDILSKDENRQITYGRGSNLNIPGHRVAVKTGTSEPYADTKKLIGDTWTIGYTPEIAVGVWVGNSDNSPMVNIFSTTIAGRTWHDTMLAVLEGKPARDWVRPEGIIEAEVCVPSGRRPLPDERCRTVKGLFAAEALARLDAAWWGGQKLASYAPAGATRVPEEITGVKRYLAEEYIRWGYRAPAPAAPTPSPAPAPPPVPDAALPPTEGGNRGDRGNGNGNGNR